MDSFGVIGQKVKEGNNDFNEINFEKIQTNLITQEVFEISTSNKNQNVAKGP